MRRGAREVSLPSIIRSFSVQLSTHDRLTQYLASKAGEAQLRALLRVRFPGPKFGAPLVLDDLHIDKTYYPGLLRVAGATTEEEKSAVDCDDFKRIVGAHIHTSSHMRLFNKALRAAQAQCRKEQRKYERGLVARENERSVSCSKAVDLLLNIGMDTLEERSAACRQKVTPCEK